MPGSIQTSVAGSVVTVAIANPGKLNAVDLGMWQQLAATMGELAADDTVRCIVLRGAGDEAFAAGGDLEEFLTTRDTVDKAMHYHGCVGRALRAIADCPQPTIAMINGACIGGGLEIAGQCDLRIAGESARFGAPINRAGFSMYPEEMAGLLRLAGPATVLEILLEGRLLSAAEALQKGLLSRIVADERLADEVAGAARRICDGAPLVARWHKRWVRRLQQETPLSDAELRASFAFLDTEDYREGLAAFLEKRKPVFKGR
ncbi:MAG: enoyl-CoA hydratase/isomerase family protein [Rhodocyclales bacterium]|nr:enoyl-CoA hydratase/isomerase family protein [Rhodocyclales bacterium]